MSAVKDPTHDRGGHRRESMTSLPREPGALGHTRLTQNVIFLFYYRFFKGINVTHTHSMK